MPAQTSHWGLTETVLFGNVGGWWHNLPGTNKMETAWKHKLEKAYLNIPQGVRAGFLSGF